VTVVISREIRGYVVHCVGRRIDTMPRRPWFSAICVKSKCNNMATVRAFCGKSVIIYYVLKKVDEFLQF